MPPTVRRTPNGRLVAAHEAALDALVPSDVVWGEDDPHVGQILATRQVTRIWRPFTRRLRGRNHALENVLVVEHDQRHLHRGYQLPSRTSFGFFGLSASCFVCSSLIFTDSFSGRMPMPFWKPILSTLTSDAVLPVPASTLASSL